MRNDACMTNLHCAASRDESRGSLHLDASCRSTPYGAGRPLKIPISGSIVCTLYEKLDAWEKPTLFSYTAGKYIDIYRVALYLSMQRARNKIGVARYFVERDEISFIV